MKGLLPMIIGGVFCVASAVTFASAGTTDTTTTNNTTMNSGNSNTMKKTAMKDHWICTTNASSSSVEADQKADDEMAKKTKSAMNAFTFASKHCRDCTKITCEVQSNNTQNQ